MQLTTIGIDLAKNVFRVHGVDRAGKAAPRKKVTRRQLLPLLADLGPSLVGMEGLLRCALLGARDREAWPPSAPDQSEIRDAYVKTNKNDANDAEAICEAVSRPAMRFVPIKSQAQQDALSVHRVRGLLMRQRSSLINQMRGLLAEYGIVIAKGTAALRRALPAILEDQTNTLSGLLRELLLELRDRLRLLEERLHGYDLRIENLARSSAQAGRLMTVPGVGPLTATALIAAVGNAQQFRNGRQLSAWLGLVPAQNSSGNRTVLIGISKRGDRYLRTLLIHGARIALHHSSGKIDPTSRWVNTIKQRRGYNVATVALANKNARVLWALLTRGESYSAARLAASHPSAPGRLRAAG